MISTMTRRERSRQVERNLIKTVVVLIVVGFAAAVAHFMGVGAPSYEEQTGTVTAVSYNGSEVTYSVGDVRVSAKMSKEYTPANAGTQLTYYLREDGTASAFPPGGSDVLSVVAIGLWCTAIVVLVRMMFRS